MRLVVKMYSQFNNSYKAISTIVQRRVYQSPSPVSGGQKKKSRCGFPSCRDASLSRPVTSDVRLNRVVIRSTSKMRKLSTLITCDVIGSSIDELENGFIVRTKVLSSSRHAAKLAQ